ncbi:MAG TPA: ATP-binding cassette domain-containing protein [Rhizomicrobium sp.]
MSEKRILLQLRGARLRAKDFPALDNFSLTLESGARIALIGESGKEAVLRLIAQGPGRGESLGGEIGFGGRDMLPLHRMEQRLRIGFLPDPRLETLSPHANAAGQLVRILARGTGIAPMAAREKLQTQLERLAGAPALDAFEKKPVALSPTLLAWGFFAVAMALEPEILLCDAPWDDLGPRLAGLLVAALLREQQRLGFALLYAARDLRLVRALEAQTIVLCQGKTVEEGAFDSLAKPYSQNLLRSLPRRQAAAPQKINRGEPLLQVQGLKLRKGRKQEALSFELRRGAALALIGEEGSGRHALMRAALGIDPVAEGRIVFDAVDLRILSRSMTARLRRRIAFVDGSDAALDPRLTIRDTVDEPLRANLNMSRELLDGHREAALGRVGIGSLPEDRLVATLSTFDKRRLQIARAMVSLPQLVVLDAPLQGLDVLERGVIAELLRDLRRREGPVFLLITHDFAVAQALAEEGFVLQDGRVIERGPLFEMTRAPRQAHTSMLVKAALGHAESVSQKPLPGVETAQVPLEENP